MIELNSVKKYEQVKGNQGLYLTQKMLKDSNANENNMKWIMQ